MSANPNSIFYDPHGRRARATNAIACALILVFSGTLAVVGYGLVIAPSLPRLNTKSEELGLTSGNNRTSTTSVGQQFSPFRSRQLPASATRVKRFAFFANSDPSSLISLRQNAAALDAIIPDWIFLDRSERGIVQENPARESMIRGWLKDHADVEIYPQLSSNLPLAATTALLATTIKRSRIAAAVASYLRTNGYQGITVSLPDLPPTAHADLVEFLRELNHRIHPDGGKVILILPPSNPDSRYQELARVVDFVLLSTHQGIDDRKPGPIASQGWFEAQIATAIASIGRTKLIVGLGSYGQDWDDLGRNREIAVQTAWDVMQRSHATLGFDAQTLNPHFNYVERGRQRHEVWFLDGVTVYNQAKTTLSRQPAGVAVWRLGLEDPSVWISVGRGHLPDRKALAELRDAQPGNDVYTRTKGDIISSTADGKGGQREITYNDDFGLIVRESFDALPKQVELAAINPIGKKLIALTFDDGPDQHFTPSILDILAQKHVKATFFMIGKNAVANPALLKRVYEEGHDIGNHTYSHPDLLENAGAPIELELNGAQRVFESVLGIHTIFFRPPYAGTDFLQLSEAPRVVESASRLGYLTVGASVDPDDWADPTAQQIIDRVTQAIEEEDGQIVLLHDSGGDRGMTIAALPKVIDALTDRGFAFVTLHELIGKSREEVMPLVDTRNAFSRVGQNIRSTWFLIVRATGQALPIIVIVATVLGVLRLSFILIAACFHKRKERRRSSLAWRPASLAILVPAYNEATVICKTVQSLLSSAGDEDFDIVVVDDGSTDGTADAVRQAFSEASRVKVYNKPNGGKAAALNYALTKTRADVVVAIDADTILEPSAVDLLVRHFVDPSVGAVAGTATVGNQVNLITRFQALEYVTSQNLDRRAFELFNAIGVVPGAIGAWRREALLEVGGYASDTLAEDADLTVAIERRNWRVVYEPRALAMTEAPETVRAFLKQRFRWMFGTLQVAHKHSRALIDGGPLGIALVTIPNVYLFQFAFTLLAPVVDAMLLWNASSALASSLLASGLQDTDSLRLIAAYWLLFQTLDLAAAAVALRLDGAPKSWSLLPLILLQRFCYRQLLYVVAIQSITTAVKGRIVGWGKLARTGRVAMEAGQLT